ncbi:hypothetical protein K493DRAFT_342640 [Basidiobolus meristosporus CBS 931.73]|uniref:Phox-like protein n=1 Tax=Basidiobolus meristosporus CBS 931.73 TaxID=1314790 RepID=A0A1Y1X2G9_9FUNG|nr:hypothetical protein K493DRAFT_342640 [Basidiobolus meristosporus CBS 931.73]|eukprot:ORX79865.1 hypothetical protein K493DRAFT_342640 [Basidiobolus meristosporus CBS 931.73]
MRAPKLFRRSTYTITRSTSLEPAGSYDQESLPDFPAKETSLPEPKKYVKALHNYRTPLDKDFGFRAGEVLYVIGQENDRDWWVVFNPITKKSGLVPVKFLKVIEDASSISPQKPKKARSAPASRSGSSSHRNRSDPLDKPLVDLGPTINTRKRGISNAQATLYGEVHASYVATSPEHLSVIAGEVVIVVGCTSPDWVSVKPIGKRVGPGLIPSSHVDVYDALTQAKVIDIMQHLPKPESIKHQVTKNHPEKVELNQVVSASVYGYRFFEDTSEYDLEIVLSSAPYFRQLIKTYQEFYEFHLGLLQLFPEYTGLNGLPRIIPYLPAPATVNSIEVARLRATQLTTYLAELCELPREVKGSFFFRGFFGETQPPTRLSYDFNLEPTSSVSSLRTPSLTESDSSRSSTPVPAYAKVKVIYGSDIIAIKVSTDITLAELRKKIFSRIGDFKTLRYSTDCQQPQLNEINSECELKSAWNLSFRKDSVKLVLHAE